jgi:hypothetical protein
VDVANEIILHAGLSFSMVPKVEASSQCQSDKDCEIYCPAPSKGSCVDGVCKCHAALKAEVLRTEAITTCQSNSECQKGCDNPSGAFCIDGKCSCN